MLASVAKCKDYEFLCNNLEKSIGHKITEFQAALDNYDKQDAVAIVRATDCIGRSQSLSRPYSILNL